MRLAAEHRGRRWVMFGDRRVLTWVLSSRLLELEPSCIPPSCVYYVVAVVLYILVCRCQSWNVRGGYHSCWYHTDRKGQSPGGRSTVDADDRNRAWLRTTSPLRAPASSENVRGMPLSSSVIIGRTSSTRCHSQDSQETVPWQKTNMNESHPPLRLFANLLFHRTSENRNFFSFFSMSEPLLWRLTILLPTSVTSSKDFLCFRI